MIRSDAKEVKDIRQKDTFEFLAIIKPTMQNIEVYTGIVQNTVDKFLDMQSQRFLLKGDQNSGRSHTLIGMPQDPGLLMVFTAHLFFKLEELKIKQRQNNFTNRYNYKMFLKAYQKIGNENFDLLCANKVSMCSNESVISFDSQLTFLKLLRVILKNVDQRRFDDPKLYHTFQTLQSKFTLDQICFDFILERQETTWYGTQSLQSSHYRFQIEDTLTESPIYNNDMIMYMVDPNQKSIGPTRILLKKSQVLNAIKYIDIDHNMIIKNKFNFIQRSVLLITLPDIQKSTIQLIQQFIKELSKLKNILSIKFDVVEQCQLIARKDQQIIGKIIITEDVREFLLSRFQLYQIQESWNEHIEAKKQLDDLYTKQKRIQKQRSQITAETQNQDIQSRIFYDIKRNMIDIIQSLKAIVNQDQHRASSYVKIQQMIEEEMIKQCPQLQLPQDQQDQLPSVTVRNSSITQSLKPQQRNVKSQLNLQEILQLEKNKLQRQIDHDSSQISSIGRFTTEHSKSYQHKSIQDIKSLLKKPIYIDYDDNISIQQPQILKFNKQEDYKQLTKMKTSNEKILDSLSILNKSIVQNSLNSSNSIIRDFEKKVAQTKCIHQLLKKEIKLLSIPKLSNTYVNYIQKMTKLQL